MFCGNFSIVLCYTRAHEGGGAGGGLQPPHFFGNFKELLRERCFQPPHFESLVSYPTFKVAPRALYTLLLLLFFRIYVESETHLCDMALDERAIRRIMKEILDEKFEKLIAPIVQSLDFIVKEYKDLKKEVTIPEETNLDQKNSNLSRQVAGLTNELRQCKNEQDEQEQYIRRECAEIRGMPARRGQNTNEIVQKVGALMDLDIDDSEISISHRLPSRTSNRSDSDRTSPPIIVRLKSGQRSVSSRKIKTKELHNKGH